MEITFCTGNHQRLLKHGGQGLGAGQKEALVAFRKLAFKLFPEDFSLPGTLQKCLDKGVLLVFKKLVAPFGHHKAFFQP